MKQSFLGFVVFFALAALCFFFQLLRPHFISLPVVSRGPRAAPQRSRLEFVNYTSSEWEKLWLDNVDKWILPLVDARSPPKSEACRQLLTEQAHYVHDFLNLTCTTRFPPPYHDWCSLEDYATPLYYNTSNRDSIQITFSPPRSLLSFIRRTPPLHPKPVVPTEKDEHIVSKFVFRDTETGEEFVEYIEPLVSHLRFPLAACFFRYKVDNWIGFVLTKSYIIPPSPSLRSSRRRIGKAMTTNRYHKRYLYFDAGASSWSKGAGGPSLEYFSNMWQRHGILFDDIYAFEARTSADTFYKSIPNLFWSDRTMYQQGYVSSRLQDDTPETPFTPKFIQDHATIDDYVVFKLDIDSPGIEEANIEFLLDTNTSDAYRWIDELFWEHHVYDNPFMRPIWFPGGPGDSNGTDQSLKGSYNMFLKMRKLGIRAHSWV